MYKALLFDAIDSFSLEFQFGVIILIDVGGTVHIAKGKNNSAMFGK